MHHEIAIYVLILAIGFSGWVQYARTVRGSCMVEKSKEYVQAARVIGVSPYRIMVKHVLPNVMGPVLVLATIHVAAAIITEATLSFLGVGVPPTSPSLGTLIRIGNEFVFSGIWWIAFFPALTLVVGVLASAAITLLLPPTALVWAQDNVLLAMVGALALAFLFPTAAHAAAWGVTISGLLQLLQKGCRSIPLRTKGNFQVRDLHRHSGFSSDANNFINRILQCYVFASNMTDISSFLSGSGFSQQHHFFHR
jgi:hypothetical protein